MTKTFEQKRGLSLRKFTLLDDKVLVETKTLRKNQKFEIKLDNVGHEIFWQSDSTVLGKAFFYVCIALPFVLIAITLVNHSIDNRTLGINCFIWWLLALLNYLKQHEDDIYLVGGQRNLSFYRTIPSEEKVLEFVNEIISASKNYLKENYSVVDVTIPEDVFLGRLHWLKDRKIITDIEFHELKSEYNYKKLL
jgi:hypothetical protein